MNATSRTNIHLPQKLLNEYVNFLIGMNSFRLSSIGEGKEQACQNRVLTSKKFALKTTRYDLYRSGSQVYEMKFFP